MSRRYFAASAVALAALALPARAQSSATESAPSTAASEACELHFWPAGGAYSVIEGPTPLYAGRGATRKDLEGVPAERQIALVEALHPAELLGLDGYRLVPHAEGLAHLDVGVPARHAESGSPCYAELIVSQIVFEDATMSSPSIRELIVLRRFGAAPHVSGSFSTWVMQRVHTTRLPHRMQSVSSAELDAAFSANLIKFAQYALHPVTSKP